MASITKKNDRYHVRVRRQGMKAQCRSFVYKEDALRWARETERSIETGLYTECDLRLGDLLSRYRQEITPQKRSVSQETYRIKAIERHPIAQMKARDIRPVHISEFRDERLAAVSGSAVIKDINVLSHVFKVAQQDWGFESLQNPVLRVRKPKHNRPRDRRLTGDELRKLFDAAKASENPYLHPLITIAIETGMRKGELLGLRWERVHLSESFAELPITKNGECRDVPLSSAAKDVLRSLPRRIDGAVFPIHLEALKGLWKRALKRAEIEDLHFHDLRHEAASRLFEQGLNVMEVAAIIGHKDLRMLKRYTHLNASKLASRLV